jgi:hypothetical protein
MFSSCSRNDLGIWSDESQHAGNQFPASLSFIGGEYITKDDSL